MTTPAIGHGAGEPRGQLTERRNRRDRRRHRPAYGQNPLLHLNRNGSCLDADVLAKLAAFKPGGGVRDRIGLSMIEAAERAGAINDDTILLEPTTSNTGAALALVSASRGYRLTLSMPETMSLERRTILSAMGAELVLTPAADGMPGAIRKAVELAAADRRYLMLQQFKSPANPEVHRRTAAEEIWRTIEGMLDAPVASVGTRGTISGVVVVPKARNAGLRAVAVEPASSAVRSGGPPGPHKIQGIGVGLLPAALDCSVIDEVITVQDEDASAIARRLVRDEGALAGISSGAAPWPPPNWPAGPSRAAHASW